MFRAPLGLPTTILLQSADLDDQWYILSGPMGSRWVTKEQLTSLVTGVSGGRTAAGSYIVIPSAKGASDVWVGLNSRNEFLVSDRSGSGTLIFSVYKVSLTATPGSGLNRSEVEALISAGVRTDSDIQSISDARINEQVKGYALEDQTTYPTALDLGENPQTGDVAKVQSDGSIAWQAEHGDASGQVILPKFTSVPTDVIGYPQRSLGIVVNSEGEPELYIVGDDEERAKSDLERQVLVLLLTGAVIVLIGSAA